MPVGYNSYIPSLPGDISELVVKLLTFFWIFKMLSYVPYLNHVALEGVKSLLQFSDLIEQ